MLPSCTVVDQASITSSQKSGLEPDDNVVTPVVAFYARAGDVARTESVLSHFVIGMATVLSESPK